MAEYQTAFNQIKKLLSMEHVLKAPDFNKTFEIAVDSNSTGIWAVLQEKDE